MRAVARRALERVLLPLAPAARRRRARREEAAILSYHNVAPDGAAPAGDTSLHLPVRAFIDQIDRLRRTHRIVRLDELVEGLCGPGDGRPLAAITFDDAYRGALELAIPALVERGMPATIFVAPGLLGARAFWWDELASPAGSGLDARVRERVLDVECGRHASPAGAEHLRPDQGPADPATVARVAELPGVSLASHSWSHPNLTALFGEELEAELVRPRAWLDGQFRDLARADHLSFPYGRWDRRVADAAYAVGYRYLYRVEGGVASTGKARTSPLARINVPAGVSGAGFELRAAGLVGGGAAAS